MNKEELLAEAILKYPINTIFNNSNIIAGYQTDKVVIDIPSWTDNTDITVRVNSGGLWTIYRKGNGWAKKIIKNVTIHKLKLE